MTPRQWLIVWKRFMRDYREQYPSASCEETMRAWEELLVEMDLRGSSIYKRKGRPSQESPEPDRP